MTLRDELAAKLQRIAAYLDAKGLHGIFLTRQSNFSWITCGAENRVVTTSDAGAATAFAGRERLCVIANNIEAPRLRSEELAELGIDVLEYPWYQDSDRDAIIADLVAGKSAASDVRIGGAGRLERDFEELKYVLSETEIERYRWLGRNCSLVLEKVCTEVKVDQSETDIAARLAFEAMKMQITPSVVLVAADDRTLHYRHPLPTQKKVKEHVLVAFGGRRWGLVASLTRLAHLGRPSPELLRKHRAVCSVDAALILNSLPGAAAGEVLGKGLQAYQAAQFPDEWKLHHQGGPTGYEGRYYRVIPGDERRFLAGQAIAWNPSIAGTKSEDTILCGGDTPEILTPCHTWPTTQYEHEGRALKRPDMYVS